MRPLRALLPLLALFFVSTSLALADCPPGFELKDGRCDIKRDCPPGHTMREGRCVPATACPYGTTFLDGFCVAKPQSGGGK